eukprot:9695376-Lingulodinium_polyedra.AAC.1
MTELNCMLDPDAEKAKALKLKPLPKNLDLKSAKKYLPPLCTLHDDPIELRIRVFVGKNRLSTGSHYNKGDNVTDILRGLIEWAWGTHSKLNSDVQVPWAF